MALIKCSNCGKEISSNAKNCIHCGIEFEEHYTVSVNGTEKNINFFLKLSKIVKYIAFGIAVICFLLGMANDGEAFAICFIGSIMCVVIAILSTPFLEWMAYMLKNIYEINKKVGN